MNGRGRISLTIALALTLATAAGPSYGVQTTRSLSGNVRLSEGKLPDQRVRLGLYAPSGTLINELFTDSTGNFEFTGLRAGSYRLLVQAEGYQPVSVDIEVWAFTPRTAIPPITLTQQTPNRAERSVAGTISAAELQVPKTAQEAFEKGRRAAEHNRLEEARNYFARAVKIYPQFCDAHYWLGISSTLLGDLVPARKALERAAELRPAAPEPYLALGKVLNLMNECQEAKVVLGKGIQRDGSIAALWVELSRAEFSLHEYSEAVEHAARALQLSADAPVEVHLILANSYLKLRRFLDAERALRTYVKLDPESPSAPKAREVLDRLHRAGVRAP